MGYYFRVFCTSPTVPPLNEVVQWVNDRGVSAQLASHDNIENWGKAPVSIVYGEGQPTFAAEVNRKDGEDSLAAQEINEFLDMLEELKKSRKRDRVIQHLQQTQFVVACEIPAESFPDAGFHAIDVFMAYFVVHSGGMVQADGQGFYEMGKLTIELAA